MFATCFQIGNGQSALKVRLDIFPALQRISKPYKRSHGAFKLFMARLRNACFIIHLDAIKEASTVDVVVVGWIKILTRLKNVGLNIVSTWFVYHD